MAQYFLNINVGNTIKNLNISFMKLNLFIVLLATCTALSFASCKKEDAASKKELLTTGTWKVVALTAQAGPVTYDLYKEMDDCDKDDYLTFKPDGVIEYNAGATKCEEDDAQVETGTWKFTDNETKLVMGEGEEKQEATILSLTKSELKVSTTETESGITATVIATFKH